MEETFNIVDYFFQAAAKYPKHIAIIEKNKKITYSEFEVQVRNTAAYFISKGIKKGDRVMIFVPMGIDLYRIVLALIYIGATAVFLDEWVNRKRMEICCQIAQCKGFIGIFKARVYSYLIPELRKIPINLGVSYKKVNEEIPIERIVSKSDTALITFTTGSTGTPKAAKRTHGFLNEQFNALLEKMDPKPEDVDMPVLPILLLINLGVGCTSVIADFKASKPESLRPEKILEQILQNKVSRIVSSPFFVKQLSKFIINSGTSTPTLKKIFTGGAPVFPSESALYNKAFPNTHIEILYGSTEAEPISSINSIDLENESKNTLTQGLNVGIPYHLTKVKIIKVTPDVITCENEQQLEELELPLGEIGEIIVSGPHILREYLNNEQALKQNKIFIRDSCWHRTGDSGYFDATGKLFLTGRCNTLIYTNGKIIAPFIYENYFSSLPEVEMGTILMLENRLTAIIELKEANKELEVRNQLKKLDIDFDTIFFIQKMPRDPRHFSKIDYDKLKKIAFD